MYFSYHTIIGNFSLSNSLFETLPELQVAYFTCVDDKLNGMSIVYTIGITTYTFCWNCKLHMHLHKK
jgi:hypothetical protein